MKRLIIRLSSLGDVVLASTALQPNSNAQIQSHFLTSDPYVDLFKGHLNLKVIPFKRSKDSKTNLLLLAEQISIEEFDVIVDLQGSLRTLLLRVLIIYNGLKAKMPSPRWKVYRKERFRRFLFVLLKEFCPKPLRPRQVYRIWNELIDNPAESRPNLKHLKNEPLPDAVKEAHEKSSGRLITVMPASIWPAKQVDLEFFVNVLQSIQATYIVLGTAHDQASLQLLEALRSRAVPVVDGIQKWSLPTLGAVLAVSKGYVGADTGLAHLSEAVGTPAIVIFGPTKKDFGFGPHLDQSIAVETTLGCSPCGKDGRYCYRVTQRFLCQKNIPEVKLRNSILQILDRKP